MSCVRARHTHRCFHIGNKSVFSWHQQVFLYFQLFSDTVQVFLLHGTKDVRPDPCCPRTAQPFFRENSMCYSSGVEVRVRSDQAFQKFEPTGFSTCPGVPQLAGGSNGGAGVNYEVLAPKWHNQLFRWSALLVRQIHIISCVMCEDRKCIVSSFEGAVSSGGRNAGWCSMSHHPQPNYQSSTQHRS